ncbi:MAG TPA: hypothetical protein VGL34_02335 [Steroidobacteraceae bacterium]|jgi:hypothetical protein
MMNSLNSLFDIEGKIALVTGGVNGLGRMISEGLLRAHSTYLKVGHLESL